MYSEEISNVARMLSFLDNKESYGGDTTEVELDFYDG